MTPRSLHVWAAGVVAAALAAVFVIPWILPTHVALVQSDSQAVGFGNRYAMVGLALGAIALFGLAWYARRAGAVRGESPLTSARVVPVGDRVNPWLTRAVVGLTLLMVLIVSLIMKDHPYGDALYFTDRMLRMIAGAVPYSQIEFTYGPILAYLPLLTWRLLQWTGVSIYAVYYCWVAVSQALGLTLTAYFLNRIQTTKLVRNMGFLVVGAFALLQPTLGLNYTPLRFIVAYALFLWAMGRLIARPGGVIRSVTPLLAVAIAAGVSPEMGIALFGALAVTLVLLVIRRSRSYVAELLVLLGGAAVVVAVLSRVGAGTLGAVAGGAYYFPVLPGPPALVFAGTLLVLAWGTGVVCDQPETDDFVLGVGLLALAVVLIAPAFGRADFGHVFWNGLGAILLCAVVIERRWHRASDYLAVAAVVFVGALVLYCSFYLVPGLITSSIKTAPGLQSTLTSDKATASRLAALPALAFPESLEGDVGSQVALSGHLVPLYCAPGMVLDEADFRKFSAQLAAASTLALPTPALTGYLAVASRGTSDSSGMVMSVPKSRGSRKWYGILLGFPITLKGRYAEYDPNATFGVLLQRDWVPSESFGGYTVLRRR
jgi:hypothetical protein